MSIGTAEAEPRGAAAGAGGGGAASESTEGFLSAAASSSKPTAGLSVGAVEAFPLLVATAAASIG